MKLKLAFLLVIFAGVSFILFHVFIDDHKDAISLEEAEAIAVGLYDGNIIGSKKSEEDKYMISVENDKGIYQLTVDRHTKKVSNVKQLEKREIKLTLDEAKQRIQQETGGKVTDIKKSDGSTAVADIKKGNNMYTYTYDLEKGKIISSNLLRQGKEGNDSKNDKANQEKHVISKQQLAKIAKTQLDGTVSNIKKLTSDHGNVYKVTIENRVEGAHVYIREVTKKVTSVSWFSKTADDDGDDDSSDSDDDDSDDDLDDDLDDEADDD